MSAQQPESGPKREDDNDDFEIIVPPNKLAQKAKKAEGSLDDLLKNAESLLSEMKDDFAVLIDGVVADLYTIHSGPWSDLAQRREAIAAFARAANTIKGKSGSFGYGVLGEVADLFRDYVRETPPADQQSAAIGNYIGTLQILWKQRIAGDGGIMGRQIVADFTALNEKSKKT